MGQLGAGSRRAMGMVGGMDGRSGMVAAEVFLRLLLTRGMVIAEGIGNAWRRYTIRHRMRHVHVILRIMWFMCFSTT